jgi:hypothetical protein
MSLARGGQIQGYDNGRMFSQLRNLGLLDADNYVKEAWRGYIMSACKSINLRHRIILDSCGSHEEPLVVDKKREKSLHDILSALKITSPDSLRQLLLKCLAGYYVLDDHVARQLRALGFLEGEGELIRVQTMWQRLVIKILLYSGEHLNRDLIFIVSIEDIKKRYPRIAHVIEHLDNPILRLGQELTNLLLQYRLGAHEHGYALDEHYIQKMREVLARVMDTGTILTVPDLI